MGRQDQKQRLQPRDMKNINISTLFERFSKTASTGLIGMNLAPSSPLPLRHLCR